MFSSLNGNSEIITKRFKKAECLINDHSKMNNLQEDFYGMKHDWCRQYSAISWMNVSTRAVSKEEIKAQLVMAKGVIGMYGLQSCNKKMN